MLSRLQADYQRLEQSLQRLTDSIAAYNPSTSAAEEVVAADHAITQDLDLLAQHQSNHARLEQLRQSSASLDKTLKATFELLVQTRREIKAIPTYTDSQVGKPLQVKALLDYSKFISRTSVPPTRRMQAAAPPRDVGDSGDETKPITTNGIVASPVAHGNDGQAETINGNIGMKMLDPQTKRMLNPFEEAPFEPWPRYDILQQGALADIQRMIDAGKDPAGVLSIDEQAEADRVTAMEEEREKREQEERERRRHSHYHGSGKGAAQDDVFDPDEA